MPNRLIIEGGKKLNGQIKIRMQEFDERKGTKTQHDYRLPHHRVG